jgi:hypothetical protein
MILEIQRIAVICLFFYVNIHAQDVQNVGGKIKPICGGRHYAQTTTNNVNKTRAPVEAEISVTKIFITANMKNS